MENKSIPLNNIKPNDWNPNELSDEQFTELVREVKHLGKPPKPIVLRKKGERYEIVDGEQTFNALKELGFTELGEGWYVVEDYDDIEAMGQTYKRNLGGKNNAVMLGLMFAKALEDSGMSNRQLAEKWGISEGTIRNYLPYASAAKLRNDYANLSKLNKEQIRAYLIIAEAAQLIADYWLFCGGLTEALIWFSDVKYNETPETLLITIPKILSSFKEIMKYGADKMLIYKTDVIPQILSTLDRLKNIHKFKNGIKKAYQRADFRKRMEKYFNWDKNVSKEKIDEYLDLYFDNPILTEASKEIVENLFSMIIKKVDDKLEFLLTPEELNQCLQLNAGESVHLLLDKVKLFLSQKYHLAPSEIYIYNDSLDNQLDALEIEKRAPDYIKELKSKIYIPRKLILAFLDVEGITDENRKNCWDRVVSHYNAGKFRKINESDQYRFYGKISDILTEEGQKELKIKEIEALVTKTPRELAQLFFEKTGDFAKSDQERQMDLIEKMANNFPKVFLIFLIMLADKYYEEKKFREIRKMISENIKKEEQKIMSPNK